MDVNFAWAPYKKWKHGSTIIWHNTRWNRPQAGYLQTLRWWNLMIFTETILVLRRWPFQANTNVNAGTTCLIAQYSSVEINISLPVIQICFKHASLAMSFEVDHQQAEQDLHMQLEQQLQQPLCWTWAILLHCVAASRKAHWFLQFRSGPPLRTAFWNRSQLEGVANECVAGWGRCSNRPELLHCGSCLF